MGKASRMKRERQKVGVTERTVRRLPVLTKAPQGIGSWDGVDGYATGAAAKLLKDCGTHDMFITAYTTTGVLVADDVADELTAEQLLTWGDGLNAWEVENWEEFVADRPDITEKFSVRPGGTITDLIGLALIDAAWGLTIDWPTSTAAIIVNIITGENSDESVLEELPTTAAQLIANLKNDGVFTNQVTKKCVEYGEEFNVADLVRSYLGVANYEPAVIRMHNENTAAAMIAVHSCIVAGALTAGVDVTEGLQRVLGASEDTPDEQSDCEPAE